MRRFKVASIIIAAVTTVLFAYTAIWGGTVKGTVTPLNSSIKCWAISKTDTFQTNIVNGAFELPNIKPGNYRILIEAIPPYKNTSKEGIDIRNGEVVDIGEIRMQR